MKILGLFLLLIVPVAQAADDCSKQVRALDAAIAKADSDPSDGQFEACVPAKDPSKKTTAIVSSNERAAAAYAAAYQRYVSAKARIDKIVADVAAGGSICGAPQEVKDDVAKLRVEVIDDSADLETQEKAIGANEYAFNTQYLKGRGFSMTNARMARPKTCTTTARNGLILQKSFHDASATCAGLYSGSSDAVHSLENLSAALRGCPSAN